MVDVVDNEPFELVLVPDDGAVEEFAADGADPPFGERIRYWCAHRRLEDLDPVAAEDLVEGIGELAAPVVYECTRSFEVVAVAEEQVPCGLGGPWSGRVRGETAEEHLPSRDVDEEQRVVAARLMVSTQKKSQAIAAWERRNAVQVTLDRCGAGSMLLSRRICQTWMGRWCGRAG